MLMVFSKDIWLHMILMVLDHTMIMDLGMDLDLTMIMDLVLDHIMIMDLDPTITMDLALTIVHSTAIHPTHQDLTRIIEMFPTKYDCSFSFLFGYSLVTLFSSFE